MKLKQFFQRFSMYYSEYSNVYRKTLLSTIVDYLLSYVFFKCSIRDYFTLGFPCLNFTGKQKYITALASSKYYQKFNNQQQAFVLNSKEEALICFKDYINRDWCGKKYNNSTEKCANFEKQHSMCIVKPLSGIGGHGIRIMPMEAIISRGGGTAVLFTE